MRSMNTKISPTTYIGENAQISSIINTTFTQNTFFIIPLNIESIKSNYCLKVCCVII